MVSRRNRTLLSLTIFLGVLAWSVAAAAVKGETGTPVGNLTVHEIEEQLQV
jgi:zinc transporter 7